MSIDMPVPLVCGRSAASRWRKNRASARGPRCPATGWNAGPSLRHGAPNAPGGQALNITIADIEAARRVIQGAVLRTPMLPAPRLSALTGADVYVKYENLQVTNSFKDRGALNKLASLSEAERKRGVIAMSAGNHAQAVAYHAARLEYSGDHRHAGDHALREGGGHQVARRRSGARRRDCGGSGKALRADIGRAQADAGAPLRRCAHHRRARHHRA